MLKKSVSSCFPMNNSTYSESLLSFGFLEHFCCCCSSFSHKLHYLISSNSPSYLLHKIFNNVKLLSRVRLFVIPWTVVHQVPLSVGFSRQEYWSGLPCPSPGIIPTQGLSLSLLCLLHRQADSLLLASPEKPNMAILLFSRSVVSDPLQPHGLQHARLPCSSPSST